MSDLNSELFFVRTFRVECMHIAINKSDFPENAKDKENYNLEFSDDFEGEELSKEKWLPFYVPFCSPTGIAIPSYEIRKGNLALKITEEQEPWCPEFNGEIKCSSIQTGIYSGRGEGISALQETAADKGAGDAPQFTSTYVPQYGYFEIRARMLITNSNMVSFRMRGYDSLLKKSAEVYIFEVKGKSVKGNFAKIGYGIRKFQDKKIDEEFYETAVDIDVSRFHCYAVEWDSQKFTFYIDNKKIKQIDQLLDYPMQLMLGIFELPVFEKDIIDRIYPKELIVDYVRCYKRK